MRIERIVNVVGIKYRRIVSRGLRPSVVIVGSSAYDELRAYLRIGRNGYVQCDSTGHRLYVMGVRVLLAHDVDNSYVEVFSDATEF